MLDDSFEVALRIDDQPAIFPAIGRAHAEHDDRGLIASAAAFDQPLQRGCGDQRRIAIEDQQILAALAQCCAGCENRMAGAELFILDRRGVRGDRLGHARHARRHHDDDG